MEAESEDILLECNVLSPMTTLNFSEKKKS